MNTIELNTAEDIRMISDEDLGAVAGGFQTYGGGGGKVLPGGFRQGDPGVPITGFGVVTGWAFIAIIGFGGLI
ncbi:MAG: hypothetical protein JO141_25755 [Bradyrhizobium sp.]|nr:hypothetical protein [Bradyrhizobium sp.]